MAGRLLEFGLVRRVHPLWSARVAAMGHPVGVLALVAAGPLAAPVFAVMHGAGIGILTIAKGTLPLALFGGASIAHFAWMMLFGIIIGTSSSIFIAAPILLFLGENRLRRDAGTPAKGADAAMAP